MISAIATRLEVEIAAGLLLAAVVAAPAWPQAPLAG
jgi:hypothetical protein